MPRKRKYASDAERQAAYRERQAQQKRNAIALRNNWQHDLDRPALRFHGGKWRIGQWIIDQFPPHVCYVEPFSGGASVLLRKPPSKFEVINDLDGDVVTFFRMLRERPAELIDAIELTPFARGEHAQAWEPTDDPLEQARRFYVRSHQSFGSGTSSSAGMAGWRFQINAGNGASAIGSWNDTHHLWAVAHRLKQVQIECDDALKVIERFNSPSSLYYVDPPYVTATRSKNQSRQGYRHELTDEQHSQLADVLREVDGMVILSGYPSDLYDDLYGDWTRLSKSTRDITSKEQTECLWLSPRTIELARLPVFGGKI